MKTQITNQHSNTVAAQPSTTFHKEDRMKNQSSMSLLKKSPLAVIIMVCAILSATMSAGQGPSPAKDAGQAGSGQLRGAISVELAKSLDSKKLKEGDEVDAKLAADIQTGDGTIPRGTKLIGHVTEAKARSKGDSESTLGIVFDKMSRPGSGDTPIKSVIQAAAPNPKADAPAGGVMYGGLSEATEKSTFSPTAGATGKPILNQQSRGVLGIKNLQLGPNGVFISSGKEVKLDSGMQILLDVTMQTSAQTDAGN